MTFGSNLPPAPPPYNPQAIRTPSPYDFLNDAGQPSKKSKLPLLPNSTSKKGRMFVAVSIGLILIMLFVIVIGLFNNAGQADARLLIAAARQQNELIRVADIGVDKARGQVAKNLAVTTKLSLQSQQPTVIDAVKVYQPRFSTKDLTAGSSSETDALLASAEQNNRFDEEFMSWLQASLAEYQEALRQAHDSTDSNQLKATLAVQYQSAQLLADTAKANG